MSVSSAVILTGFRGPAARSGRAWNFFAQKYDAFGVDIADIRAGAT
jgi:hypothetical protein